MKRIFTLLFLVSFIISTSIPSHATDSFGEKEVISSNSVISVYSTSIPKVLDKTVSNDVDLLLTNCSTALNISSKSTLSIGNGFNMYRLEDNEIVPSDVYYYPVLESSEIVAFIVYAVKGDEIIAVNTTTAYIDEFNKLEQKDAFQVVDVDQNIYAYNKNGWTLIKSTKNTSAQDLNNLNLSASKNPSQTISINNPVFLWHCNFNQIY